jgi:hypothetical protein
MTERSATTRTTNKESKIKKHFKENKKAYICAAGGVFIGVIGTFAFASRVEVIQIVDAIKLQWKSPTTNEIITILVPRECPRAVPVMCNETGEVFASINRAAHLLEVAQSAISRNLSGETPHVKGLTFTKLGEAA